MTEDKICHNLEKLRSPQRVALLETERVVHMTLEGITALSLLDIGTGNGLFAQAFAAKGLQVTGIDVQERMLAAARTFVPEVEFHIASAEALPFPNLDFDLAFLGHVLHESDTPLLVLQETFRVIRKRAAVLEWPYQKKSNDPPQDHRMRSEEIWDTAAKAGFQRTREIRLQHMMLYLLDK